MEITKTLAKMNRYVTLSGRFGKQGLIVLDPGCSDGGRTGLEPPSKDFWCPKKTTRMWRSRGRESWSPANWMMSW